MHLVHDMSLCCPWARAWGLHSAPGSLQGAVLLALFAADAAFASAVHGIHNVIRLAPVQAAHHEETGSQGHDAGPLYFLHWDPVLQDVDAGGQQSS